MREVQMLLFECIFLKDYYIDWDPYLHRAAVAFLSARDKLVVEPQQATSLLALSLQSKIKESPAAARCPVPAVEIAL